MRLKSEIWAMAHIRRVFAEGATAVVERKGDADAGAIYIRTRHGDGSAALFGPAPEPQGHDAGERYWRLLVEEGPATAMKMTPNHQICDRLVREIEFDPDIWVIEIEDMQGRHFLDNNLISSGG